MPKIQGLNVSRKYFDSAVDYRESFDRSINSIDYLGETIQNPYALSDADIEYLGLYYSGKNFFKDSNQERLTNALEKYQAAQEWYAQMQQQAQDIEYNEPVNQVSRNDEAGLNSDLLGIDQSSSAADGDVSMSGSEPFAGPGTAQNFAQVMGVIGTTLQAAGNIVQLLYGGAQLAQGLRNQRAEYAGHILNDILPSVIGLLPESSFASDESFSSSFTPDLFTGLGFSRRDYDMSSSMLKSLKRSPSQLRELFKNKSEFERFRQDFGELVTSPFRYNPTDPNELLSTLQSLEADKLLWENRASIAAAQYERAFNSLRDPELSADAFDSENRQTIKAEDLQELEYQHQVALMGCVIPRLQYAESLIKSGDPYNCAAGQTILADIVSPSNTLWSLVARYGNGFLDNLQRTFFPSTLPDGSSGSGTPVDPNDPNGSYITPGGLYIPKYGRFFREVHDAVKAISRGEDPEFYGLKWSVVKGFFQDIDRGIAASASEYWDNVKKALSDTGSSSGSPVPNMLDGYDYWYGR